MKIKIMREGGFIGITSKANLEFEKLTEAEQNAFTSLANLSVQKDKKEELPNPPTSKMGSFKAGVLDAKERNLDAPAAPSGEIVPEMRGMLPPRGGSNPMMRDGFSYSVSMKKDGKTVSLKFDDGNAPAEIVEIFQKYVQY